MKTLKKEDHIVRVADKEVDSYLNRGYLYVPKSIWKEKKNATKIENEKKKKEQAINTESKKKKNQNPKGKKAKKAKK